MRLTRRDFIKGAASAAAMASPVVGALSSMLAAPKKADAWICTTPPGASPHGPSKLGFHCVGGNNPICEYIQQLHDNGAYFPIIKCVGDFSYAACAKELTPKTVTVGRQGADNQDVPNGADPLRLAEERMKFHMTTCWSKNRDNIDYWEVINEADPPCVAAHRRLGEFYMKCMEIAEKNGYKLAIMSYAVGVPEWEEFEALFKMGVFHMAKAGGHVLALHEYNDCRQCNGWGRNLQSSGCPEYKVHTGYPDRGTLTGRYRWWYRDFLIPNDVVIPLVITEAGYDFVNVEDPQCPQGWNWKAHIMEPDQMPWIDDRMREDDYVIGASLFTAGDYYGPGYCWGRAEIQQIVNRVIALKNG